jgi:hypothetical protein
MFHSGISRSLVDDLTELVFRYIRLIGDFLSPLSGGRQVKLLCRDSNKDAGSDGRGRRPTLGG